MANPILYRKRLIPEECVLLKDDRLLYRDEEIIVTAWNQLADIHHLHEAVGIDDDVRQKIGDDVCVCFLIIIIVYNITVPIQKRVVFVIETAHFYGIFPKTQQSNYTHFWYLCPVKY